MAQDICVPVGDGYVNVRVGAIIEKDGKILMVTNESVDYYYSVGGRIHLGESAGDAVRREVLEETGCAMEIDRLGFIHEDFFIGDSMAKQCEECLHELCFFSVSRHILLIQKLYDRLCRCQSDCFLHQLSPFSLGSRVVQDPSSSRSIRSLASGA